MNPTHKALNHKSPGGLTAAHRRFWARRWCERRSRGCSSPWRATADASGRLVELPPHTHGQGIGHTPGLVVWRRLIIQSHPRRTEGKEECENTGRGGDKGGESRETRERRRRRGLPPSPTRRGWGEDRSGVRRSERFTSAAGTIGTYGLCATHLKIRAKQSALIRFLC